MSQGSVDEKAHFLNEMVLGDNALKCAEAVLSLDSSNLETFKAKFSESSRGTASSGSQGAGRLESTLKSTPPIGQLGDLLTIQGCYKKVEAVYNMETKAAWTDVRADIVKALAPCRELIKEIKKRLDSIDIRQKNRQDEKKKSKSVAGPTVLFANLMLRYRVDHLMLVLWLVYPRCQS